MTFVPFLWLIAIEDEGKRVAACGPTSLGISYWQINLRGLLFFPDGTRNLFAVQQVMLDAGEDAAPVTTVESLVNDAANLYIDSVATKNPVIDPTKQIQQPALFPRRGTARTLMVVSPDLGFVLRFVLPHGA